jgi:subtilisin family serine protease/subtilisin-like proprotein convertase family protein
VSPRSATPLESLEPRTLLTNMPTPVAPLPVGAEVMNWGGTPVAALTNSYILTFDTYLGNDQAVLLAREVATRLGVTGSGFRSIGRGRWATFNTTSPIAYNAAQALTHSMADLKYIEPNQVYAPDRVPNDTRFADQYAMVNTGQIIQGVQGTIGADIHVQQAWDTTIGSRNVIVADIDTGIDLTHPDLIPNLWTNPGEIAGNGIDDDGDGFVDDVHGYDFGTQTGSPQDTVGHGTSTAGVIGAAGNNNLGVAGVNWNVSIMALKIADAQGRLTEAAIIGAQDYATMMRQRGFNIVVSNNSYGAYLPTFYANDPNGIAGERDAIQAFINSGATFVASAGNNGANNDLTTANFPASYNIPGLISVAASDNNDGMAAFTAYGPQTVTIAAPGVNVLTTTLGGGYGFESGTSFSGPLVAGAVALLQAYWESTHSGQNASAVQIREALINGADPLPAFQGKVVAGGRLDVFRSMQIMGIAGPTVRAVVPGPVVGQIDPSSGAPFHTVTITLSHDIDPASLSASSFSLIGAGTDGNFGTGDDVTIPVSGAALSPTDPRVIIVTLDLTAFAQQRLPVDHYQLTIRGAGGFAVKDTNGNFLNGNTSTGTDEVYNFRVVGTTGDNEPNDTMAQATPVVFDASGQATFSGATIGNGINVNLDVDLYRIDMARGGLITAEITAKRLASPSTLDSYLRLFDANGNELANNDQTFGDDSFIDFFVTTGGTYYVGVSGFGNANYNPAVAGSGSSQSTGVYNLRLAVALENNDVVTYDSSGDTTMPRRIPFAEGQTQGTTTAVISVPDTRQILDVNVKFDITHTFDGDLQISLIGPTGVEVMLVNRRGSSGDNFTNTIMDDEATTPISSGFAPFTGSFQPESSLGAFDGLTANGNWTLKIVDAAPLNSGQLNSWSLTFTLKNDIFGPYESNDTLATAKNLQEINGTGTATRTAFIGDGGFGNFDRDIFQFTAAAGSSLTAQVTSGGALNTAVRLFDSNGVQILVSNPAGTNNSLIDNYVFANGGVYYVAVSESNNTAYDPRVAASGVTAATTGTYTLTVTLAAGVSDGSLSLSGSALAVGMNTGGTFSGPDANGANVGLKFNGVEFLPVEGVARPQMFLGADAGGFDFSNAGPTGSNDLPFSLTNEKDAFNNRVVAKAAFHGVNIERTVSYGADDSFAAIDVYFTNATSSLISNVAWMEGFNPDPGMSLNESNPATANDVDATGHFVSAKYINNQFSSGLTVALAAPTADARAKATVVAGDQTIRDPSVLLGEPVNDPNGSVGDDQLAMSFNVGNINPGTTTSIRYFIFFGTTPAAVDAMYAQVNNGTGTGHLTADPANPASEALDTGTDPAASVPTLPYKVYYPEGFFGDNIFTFVPIANLSDQTANVYAIAHYETGNRDQIVGHLTIGGNARSGLTITTPDLFHSGGTLAGRPNTPYALEVRSDRPVAAMFSHYDLTLLNGHQAAIGESFTSETDTTWSFGQVSKGNGNVDFLVFYNPTDTFTKVTAHYVPVGGGTPITETFNLDPHRRGGFAVNDAGLADGIYGATVTADVPIVVALSHYNYTELDADGTLGNTGSGSTVGVIPEGQFGLNSPNDTMGVLNAGTTDATVVFSFLFSNGSAYRTSLLVPAGTHRQLEMNTLANFPQGIPYGMFYESNTPVTVASFSRAYGDLETSVVTSQANSVWGFGEGYRPGDGQGHPGIVEKLRLYNPSETDQTVEITIGYDGVPGNETFRRTIAARTVTEFDMDQFITGNRRATQQWYGTMVKAAVPIVAYMDHYDKSFNGTVPDPIPGAAFGTLGVPLGNSAVVS